MRILVPQGIGDSIWALHKVQALARRYNNASIRICLACYHHDDLMEARSLEFIRRFSFVDSAEMYVMPHLPDKKGAILLPGEPATEDGYYRYIPTGVPTELDEIDFSLMPNAPLERGIRLEQWLPDLETNWDIMNDFRFTWSEVKLAQDLRSGGGYVVFFPGSEASNTTAGHNRGGIWRPQDWIDLGDRVRRELGLRIVVVGAPYDRPYYEKFLKGRLRCDDLVGRLGIGETFAVCSRARFVISYQSGIGIVSSYLGVPVGIFWRARGDSIHPAFYLSFDEGMASAWVRPEMIWKGKHLPLIYGRHDVNYIMEEVRRKKW